MASSGNQNYDSNRRSCDQSIPLEDLSRPPDTVTADRAGNPTRRARSTSGGSIRDGGRRSILNRRSRYARIAEDSPSRDSGDGGDAFQTISLSQESSAAGGAVRSSDAGLSIAHPAGEPSHGHLRSDTLSARGSTGYGDSEDLGSLSHHQIEYMNGRRSPDAESDRLRLTDERYLQPISGAPQGGRHSTDDRGVRFLGAPSGSGARLGDDLQEMENGLGRRHSSPGNAGRHLSVSTSGSALSRAGSMMRMMSQRVVNLSNEPEIADHSIRRKSSLKTARMEGPPSLPALTAFAHDVSKDGASGEAADEGPEKRFVPKRRPVGKPVNPLKGNSLGIFSPENKLRKALCEILIHPITEPVILILIIIQTVLLAVESSVSRNKERFEYAFLAIFIVYTLELVARTIVSGFILNPGEYSTLDRSAGLKNALISKGRDLIMPHRQLSTRRSAAPVQQEMSLIRTFTGIPPQSNQEDYSAQSRARLARRAFLRHSFNRLDFVAVVSYWIAFILTTLEVDQNKHIFVFRMLSSLRILRLLALTNGSTVILRSLKKAAPLLVNVAFFIGFFWLLFAIIGVQSFKSSFQRTCVWIDPYNVENYTLNDAPDSIQYCGGYLDNSTGEEKPWVLSDGTKGTPNPKGYLCPRGSMCVQGNNPYGGTVSFDNVLHSLELVFVIMSSNTFTDLLYATTDSDYLVTSVFFIAGFVVLSLWLVNLLIAVITSSFQVIREESKQSAFTADNIDEIEQEEEKPVRLSTLRRFYDKTYWFWIVLITFDLIAQAMRSSSMGKDRERFILSTEVAVTFVLLLEICLRLAADWRNFFRSYRNLFDLALAIITTIILLPPIRKEERAYAALTIFQILRIYRVVLAFSLTRSLIMTVFKNYIGFLNLILFVFLITFLTGIFAVQLMQGQIPKEDDGETTHTSFYDIYNSFLGMYQILSSEDWTSILYSATENTYEWGTAWISAAFFIMWFILANFVVLNMFIAVIQESFDVSEDEKRLHQVKAFLQQKQVSGSSQGNLAISTIFKLGRDPQRYRDPLDHAPAALEMLLKDAVVREFLDESAQLRPAESAQVETPADTSQPGFFSNFLTKTKSRIFNREQNPFYSKLEISRDYDELDPSAMAKEVLSASERRKQAQRQYLQRYPNYNVSLYIFKPMNPIRRLCQRIVGPGRGESRIEGVDPYKPVWYTFSAFVYAAIVAMVVIACVVTPLYQRTYFEGREYSIKNWFVWTDIAFAIIFTAEALIKVVADGFFWTPNAYFRGSWGLIDGVVLITLWINVVASLSDNGDVSRVVGAFRALRALRLLNVSDSARNTFHSVIIMGGLKVISAALVSLSFLIPFAIYGLTLFHGKLKRCNDDDFGSDELTHCVGEYMNSPYNWDILAPRSVSNPFYNFDSFGDSLFILFQIVSQEGWIDCLWDSMSITGAGLQPKDLASKANGLFFVVFNLLGAVFVLTLFVSVFMRNYTEQTGVAFLTAEQRSWLELRKLLRQVSPSKRSINKESSKWKRSAYRIAIKKHGPWARFITCLLLFHLLLLVLEFHPVVGWWDKTRDALFFILTLFFIANVVVRLLGLTWHRFRRSSWDIYSVLSVSGTFVTTLLSLIGNENRVFSQLHKLFLVSIALMLIPRNNQLDQLFKTAAASLTSIANLLATWFVLFLVFAIALTQIFGLTKFGGQGTGNINFRTVPKALVLLFRMSCGEGWNEVMEDYAKMESPYCTVSDNHFDSDCGSSAWARTLFIAWNIISMYIFVALFVSLIFESFSYVYQRSSGLYAVSREDLRRYKQAWATFDPDGTGFISKEAFPRLLGELSGVFEMRVYDGDFTVGALLEDCRVSRRESERPGAQPIEGVDIPKLVRKLKNLPVAEIRARRARLNAFYEEVLVSADPERGIAFTACLMILAHYNVITDSKSLRLEEFLRRRTRLQRVDEAVRRNVVKGFFDTLYWTRRFRRHVKSKHFSRIVEIPQFSIPEIYVEDDDAEGDNKTTTPAGGSPLGSPKWNRSPETSPRNTRQLPRIDIDTTQDTDEPVPTSPSRADWGNIRSLSPHHGSRPTSSYDGGGDLQASEGSSDGARAGGSYVQGVMESLDNSAWGESIRRSFTLRRSPGGGSR